MPTNQPLDEPIEELAVYSEPTTPKSATDILRESDKPFDMTTFRTRLRGMKEKVIDDGGIVFIPLIYGQPSPVENISFELK